MSLVLRQIDEIWLPFHPPIERSQIHSQWAHSPQSALLQRLLMKFGKLSRNFKFSEYKMPFSHQPGVTIAQQIRLFWSLFCFHLLLMAASGWDRKVPESSKASSWLALCEKEVCQQNSCFVLILC